jgi:hemoglobin
MMIKETLSKIALALFVFLIAGVCAVNGVAQSQAPGSPPALCKRLGGYDAIAAVTDDFIGRLAGDKQLERFFDGVSADSQKKLRQHVVDQLCEATGGPCIYTGRTMKTSHTGLGISESDWQLAVKHLVATLDKVKVPEKEKGELLAIASSLKADIVEKK